MASRVVLAKWLSFRCLSLLTPYKGCLLGSLILQSVGMTPSASAHIAADGFALPNSGVLVLTSAQNLDTGLLASAPWNQDREPADNPATSRILADNHTMALMPMIGLQSTQAPTVVQVRNLLVEDHVLNGQIVVATLLLEPSI